MPTPAEPQPEQVALLDMIHDLQRRQTESERQTRLLLTAIREHVIEVDPAGYICTNSACINSTQVPHMAERPYGCPRYA